MTPWMLAQYAQLDLSETGRDFIFATASESFFNFVALVAKTWKRSRGRTETSVGGSVAAVTGGVEVTGPGVGSAWRSKGVQNENGATARRVVGFFMGGGLGLSGKNGPAAIRPFGGTTVKVSLRLKWK